MEYLKIIPETNIPETNPGQNPQGSLKTEPEVPFLINEDGKKKKKRRRNLLALKPRKASSAYVEPLRQRWLPFGGVINQLPKLHQLVQYSTLLKKIE